MNIDQRNRIFSIVLIVVIGVLTVWLYNTITGPWKEVQAKQAEIQQVRNRLLAVNDAIRYYNEEQGRYPESLDSLMIFLRDDTFFQQNTDSLLRDRQFDAENFIQSPRSGNKFEYALNDTVRPQLYLIEDPDSEDHVGTLDKVTDRGAPSWR